MCSYTLHEQINFGNSHINLNAIISNSIVTGNIKWTLQVFKCEVMQALLHHSMNPVGDLTIEQFIVPDINFDSNSKGLIQSVLELTKNSRILIG